MFRSSPWKPQVLEHVEESFTGGGPDVESLLDVSPEEGDRSLRPGLGHFAQGDKRFALSSSFIEKFQRRESSAGDA